MSALTDAIQQAGPDNVAAAIRDDPQWAVFNLLWEQPGQIAPPWQWEPQAGTLHPVNFPKLGENFLATRLEYARVFA